MRSVALLPISLMKESPSSANAPSVSTATGILSELWNSSSFKKGRKWRITELSYTTEELFDTYHQNLLMKFDTTIMMQSGR